MDIIIAANNRGYIGLNNKLPWKSSGDLRHFKKLTMGKVCLVGRVTYESMPKLSGRTMVVVGSGYNTIDEALKLNIDFVIGGKRLYESVAHLCENIHLSVINDNTVGDVTLPDLSGHTGCVKTYSFDC